MDDIKRIGPFLILVIFGASVISVMALQLLTEAGIDATIYHRTWRVVMSIGFGMWAANLGLGVIGLLFSPIAATITGDTAEERGLNVRYYKAIGGLYSTHLLFPWIFLMAKMSSRNPIVKMPVWTYAVSYGIWLLGPILAIICVTAGYTWEHTIGGDYTPGDHNKLTVWRLLVINTVLMFGAWCVSAVSTYLTHRVNYENEESERRFPRRLAKSAICIAVAIPVAIGGGAELEFRFHIPAIIVMMIPTAAVAAGWFLLVDRVHQRGIYANLVIPTGGLIPTHYLSPFIYSFMWSVWLLVILLGAWSIYGSG